MAVALLSAPAEAAGKPHPQKVWHPRPVPSEHSVTGTKPKASPAVAVKPMPPATPKAVTWPKATSTDVDLTAANAAGNRTTASTTAGTVTETTVPGTPVSIVASPSDSFVSSLSGTLGRTGVLPTVPALSKAHVTVADHAISTKAGISGVVVSVSRADTATTTASVGVSLDYSGFIDAYGGDFADRLTLVELPACVLTTPQLVACQKPTPVAASNDRATDKITTRVTLPGAATPKSPATVADATSAGGAAPQVVLAATSSPSGSTGTFSATPLKSSDSWSVNNTGSFTTTEPITMPPTLGGAVPNVALNYDSGSVDDRTTAENGQASDIGDGWDYNPGFIERSYKPCAKVDAAHWGAVGDVCMTVANATLSLPGHAGELVHDDATSAWRIAGDDGSHVELLNTASNGTDNPKALDEYWRVTTPDGTRYYFGANRIPQVGEGGTGNDAPTYSTWTEPVFGTGEPTCNDPTSAAAISCMAAWRWNLDFVIDAHNNVIRYNYQREGNWYKNAVTGTQNFYTRGGYLASIDYGFQVSDVLAGAKPASQVVFGVKPRCLPAGLNTTPASECTALSVTPDPNHPGFVKSGISATTSAAFQDTPFDQSCDGTSACGNYGPSFWSSIRLDTITTGVAYTPGTTPTIVAGTGVNAGYLPVDEYTLHQSYPSTTTTALTLWLDSISHTGYTGGVATSLPDVQFGAIALPNRAPAAGTGAVMYLRLRIASIVDELHGTTAVQYDYDPQNLGIRQYPCSTTAPAVDRNTTLCFPVWWTPPTGAPNAQPTLDWFNKYVVLSVQRGDGTSLANQNGSVQYETTDYQYPDPPAWHSNDSELADPKYRTFDQFRGFVHITTIGGGQEDATKGLAIPQNSKSVTTYFRGMDQDPDLACQALVAKSPTATCSSVDEAPVSINGTVDDNALAGQVAETQLYESADASAALYTDTITAQVANGPNAGATAQHLRGGGLPRQRARFVHTASTVTLQKVAAGTRRSEIDYTYDDRLPDFTGNGNPQGNGRLVATYDLGDGTVPKICTAIQYAKNIGTSELAEWTSYPWKVSDSVQPTANCTGSDPAPAPLPDQIDQGFVQTTYDGAPAGQIGSVANVTMVQQESDASGATITKTQTPASDFDVYGRAESVADGLGRNTTTAYSPATGVLPTSATVTNPAGWTSTNTLEQTRGLTLASKDVNGQTTTIKYDGLGRTTAVWQPGRALSASPTQRFTYSVSPLVSNIQQPSSVLTETLLETNVYADTYQIIDGLGRVEQTQSTPMDNSNGLIATDTVYDYDGRTHQATGQHWDSANNPSGTWLHYDYTKLDSVTTTAFDALSRPVNVMLSKGGNNLWATTTTYYGADRVDVLPPPGGTPTSTFMDVRGRTTASWQYHENPPAAFGTSSDADVTTYTYTPVTNGANSTVTDPAGNQWITTTDLLARAVKQSDPNSGSTISRYDAAGQLIGTQDGRGQNLSFTYDVLGRKTFTYSGTSTTNSASLLSENDYDQSHFEDPAGNIGGAILGQQSASTRYIGGKSGTAYVQSTPYYDYRYQPRTTQVTIPNTGPDAGLAGTYVANNYYSPVTDWLDHVDRPAVPNAGMAAETVYYSRLPDGLLLTVAGDNTYLAETQYTPFGEVKSRTTGDYPYQVSQQTVYDPTTRRVTSTDIDSSAGVNTTTNQLNEIGVDWSTLTYNPAGNMTAASSQQGLGSPPVVDTQCYTYDFAGRLKEAWTDEGGSVADASGLIDKNKITSAPIPGGVGHCANTSPTIGNITGPKSTTAPNGPSPAPYWQTFTGSTPGSATDPMGNRVTVTDHSMTGGADTAHSYAQSGQPGTRNSGNATAGSGVGPALLGRVSTTGATTATDTYAYDGAGNTTNRTVNSQPTPTNETLSWDPEGQLSTVTDNTSGQQVAAYVYDASGNELIRRDPTTTTLFIGSTEIHLATAGTGAGRTTARRYNAFPNAPTTIAGSDGSLTVEATNGQGTGTSTIQEAAGAQNQGQVTARRYTKPYGESRGTPVTQTTTPAWPDDHTFLGKATDTSTGLVDVGARKYDPPTGRFISIDPVFQAGNPQTIGGYAYAGNDPVNASDPTGLDPGGMNCVNSAGQPVPCSTSGAPGTSNTSCTSALPGCPGYVPPAPTSNNGGGGGNNQSPSVPVPTGPGNAAPAPAVALTTPAPPSPAENPALYGPGDGPLSVIYAVTGLEDAVHCFRDGDAKSCAFTALNALPFAGKGLGILADTVRFEAEASDIAEAASRVGAACGVHSFAADTQVLMADGTTKPIQSVAVGDEIENAEPGGTVERHRVGQIHETLTDKDFTDLTVSTPTGPKTITGTQNHPYFDLTTHQFVNASDLKSGDRLQTTAGGYGVTVLNVRNYFSSMVTYDLTIDGLHTYYVVAGDTPVLVHNTDACGTTMSSAIGDDSLLMKAAEKAGKNQSVQREMDNLFAQLSEGNMNPGIGTKSLAGTDVSYARGANGARLFFRNVDGGIQIVGKADKSNESSVIARLVQLYGQ
jgi:RHS repeat-associated protein